ncbi:hypothetical protein [Nocardia sp. CA-290969]|uniref:hypothetical protein n=1 Tax=Nocardia sp. CA-290969 TaxID=3239986 RepID=UPI003D8FAB26
MSNSLAQLIWSGLHCDPEDPGTGEVWEQLPASARERFEIVATEVTAYLAQQPPQWTPRGWSCAADIPAGARFRPVGSTQEFTRGGRPEEADAFDRRFARGYVEVR